MKLMQIVATVTLDRVGPTLDLLTESKLVQSVDFHSIEIADVPRSKPKGRMPKRPQSAANGKKRSRKRVAANKFSESGVAVIEKLLRKSGVPLAVKTIKKKFVTQGRGDSSAHATISKMLSLRKIKRNGQGDDAIIEFAS